MSSRSCKILKACVVLLGVLHFLIGEAHGNGEGRLLVINEEGSGRMKQASVEAMINRKKHRVLISSLELNYISKRKVPNGPDPIHNRGAAKSHRPPAGHA